jgi:hypothetical protein
METDGKDMLVHILETHFATPVKSTTYALSTQSHVLKQISHE